MATRNQHIAENFKAQYSEIVKRYPVGDRVVEEKLEFQVVSIDDNNAHVWVHDVAINEYSSWIINTKRFLQRIGKIKPLTLLTEQMSLFS